MPKFTIHVPNFKADNQGRPATSAGDVVAAFISKITVTAGGCTVVSHNAVGYWNDDLFGLITDEQTILEVVCTGSRWQQEVLPLVSQLRIDLNQRYLYVTSVNTDTVFIP